MRASPKGFFTLVELLITISILVLLMSVLLPALNKARGKAKQIKCLNNLKQLGIAENMYVMDNQETILDCENSTWDRMLASYLHKSIDPWPGYKGVYGYDTAFVCPMGKGLGTGSFSNPLGIIGTGGAASDAVYGPGGHIIGYTMNRHLSGRKLMAIKPKNISEVLFLADGWQPRAYNTNIDYFSIRHERGLNVLYLDLHAEWNKELISDILVWW
jgi:prepilin-type processing-associated H-X9-DG protein